jgi:magnesium-transporting ATPase (P-type)
MRETSPALPLYTIPWYLKQGRSLKMGPTCCFETSATNCQSTLRNIPAGRRPHSQRDGSCNHCCCLFSARWKRDRPNVQDRYSRDMTGCTDWSLLERGTEKELVRSSFSRGYYRFLLRLNQICNTFVQILVSPHLLPAFLQSWSDCWTIFCCVMHSDRHTAEQRRIV